MTWEEELSISPSSKSVKALSKSKPPTVTPPAEGRILTVSYKDTYSNNSRSNLDLTYQKTKLQFKDSEKQLKKPKFNYLNPLKLKSTYPS